MWSSSFNASQERRFISSFFSYFISENILLLVSCCYRAGGRQFPPNCAVIARSHPNSRAQRFVRPPCLNQAMTGWLAEYFFRSILDLGAPVSLISVSFLLFFPVYPACFSFLLLQFLCFSRMFLFERKFPFAHLRPSVS